VAVGEDRSQMATVIGVWRDGRRGDQQGLGWTSGGRKRTVIGEMVRVDPSGGGGSRHERRRWAELGRESDH
jgi:hypothetical protein